MITFAHCSIYVEWTKEQTNCIMERINEGQLFIFFTVYLKLSDFQKKKRKLPIFIVVRGVDCRDIQYICVLLCPHVIQNDCIFSLWQNYAERPVWGQ